MNNKVQVTFPKSAMKKKLLWFYLERIHKVNLSRQTETKSRQNS